ncbi:MAG: hypothetical protein OEM24_13670 [Paracoccaceae bacterium]|nr:hypothetical protein [Paracoccaceae bacterium]
MSSTSVIAHRTALVGVMLVSTSLGAQAYTVSRCNAKRDQVYVPVLLIEVGGERFMHEIGTDGLTRSVVFDPDAAVAWAASRYGAAGSWTVGESCSAGAAVRAFGVGANVPDEGDDEHGPGYLPF